MRKDLVLNSSLTVNESLSGLTWRTRDAVTNEMHLQADFPGELPLKMQKSSLLMHFIMNRYTAEYDVNLRCGNGTCSSHGIT